MKVFLDDIRHNSECVGWMYKRIGSLNPIYLEEWFIVRNYNDFVKTITENINNITHVSFDHDLADFHYEMTEKDYNDLTEEQMITKFGSMEKNGYDCAKWMKEFYKEKGIKLPTMFVHSMNPVGTENIINLFKK